MTIREMIDAEIQYADKRYGPFTSSHEGLGVLLEEWTELVQAVRSNDMEKIVKEATQVAAVAARLADSLQHQDTIERSGK